MTGRKLVIALLVLLLLPLLLLGCRSNDTSEEVSEEVLVKQKVENFSNLVVNPDINKLGEYIYTPGFTFMENGIDNINLTFKSVDEFNNFLVKQDFIIFDLNSVIYAKVQDTQYDEAAVYQLTGDITYQKNGREIENGSYIVSVIKYFNQYLLTSVLIVPQ